MSKPSAVRKVTQHVPPSPVVATPVEQKVESPVSVEGSSLDFDLQIIFLRYFWWAAPDALPKPKIAQTKTEWPGEWHGSITQQEVWNKKDGEWMTCWIATYALPLTTRVLDELDRIQGLPQDEW